MTSSFSISDWVLVWLFLTVWAAICLGIYHLYRPYENSDAMSSIGVLAMLATAIVLFSSVLEKLIFVGFYGGYFAIGMVSHKTLINPKSDWLAAFFFCFGYFACVLLGAIAYVVVSLIISLKFLSPGAQDENFLLLVWIFLLMPLGSPFAISVVRRVRASMRAVQ